MSIRKMVTIDINGYKDTMSEREAWDMFFAYDGNSFGGVVTIYEGDRIVIRRTF